MVLKSVHAANWHQVQIWRMKWVFALNIIIIITKKKKKLSCYVVRPFEVGPNPNWRKKGKEPTCQDMGIKLQLMGGTMATKPMAKWGSHQLVINCTKTRENPRRNLKILIRCIKYDRKVASFQYILEELFNNVLYLTNSSLRVQTLVLLLQESSNIEFS